MTRKEMDKIIEEAPQLKLWRVTRAVSHPEFVLAFENLFRRKLRRGEYPSWLADYQATQEVL